MSAVWRQQVGSQLSHRRRRGPRNLAVVTYVVRGNATNKLIDIRRLTVCVLHDEFDQAGAPSIRFAAYRLGQIALGITVGGPDQILLDKDLALAPRRRAYGRRFARCDRRWLPLALRMDRWLERHARHPCCPRSAELQLPEFWVALKTSQVTGEGPEFARLCRFSGCLRTWRSSLTRGAIVGSFFIRWNLSAMPGGSFVRSLPTSRIFSSARSFLWTVQVVWLVFRAFGVHIVKDVSGALPVRVTHEHDQVPEGFVVAKEINVFDKFTMGLLDLARHLGITPPKTKELGRKYRIEDDDQSFRVIRIGRQVYRRYSKRALDLLCPHVGEAEQVWQETKALRKKKPR